MKSINLGATTLRIPAMALGIMRMGDKTPKQAALAIETAFDTGINFIDSADIYGGGKSEEIFGQALKLTGIRREALFIQSKAGIITDSNHKIGDYDFGGRYDFSKKHILDAVDGILKRMDTDYLDGFILHRPDPLMDFEEVEKAIAS